ncbi:MAG: 3-phosphoshikimate 1-carboxyvinyltransferase [Clostridiales Family XIII bacterium]|jgi:3-phosphoshikimate 1-carboxyvinyltransferase|nr:3-phosphoshikimate 1-carboxyvinyltransferase [Clostridiales Family XIII bacterium]
MTERILGGKPSGLIRIPASKSVSHRAAICAALAGGEAAGARAENLGVSEDIAATVRGIEQIVRAVRVDRAKNLSEGERAGAFRIDCGESGSTLRFLIPIAAQIGGEWRFSGRGRLMERPQDVYARLFPAHGAFFEQDAEGILVRGPLPAGRYELPGDVSSQFISGLLFALPLAAGDSEIVLTSPLESAGYAALTLQTMRAFGVAAEEIIGDKAGKVLGYSVGGGQRYRPAVYPVEGDWSQAAFFLCAGALGADIAVTGLSADSAQGDRRVTEVIERMGAAVAWENGGTAVRAKAPAAGLPIGRAHQKITIDARDIPDIVPPLAALSCYAKGTTHFVSAGRLRIKESDRLHALTEELSKLGADVTEEADGLLVRGKESLDGESVDAHGDHRIAMALAVAAIGCRGEVRLTGAESVAKSYPGFWNDFGGF